MKKRKKRTSRLLVVVSLCMLCTCVLAGIAVLRSRQVVQQQEQVAASAQKQEMLDRYDIFWSGDNTLLTRENVVVFDVRYEGTDNEILLSLAESIKERMQNVGIQPIFLGAETDGEFRSQLLNSEEIDLYIGLCVGKDEKDSEVFGTKCYYNEAYYVPGYNNVWFSDRLLQNVVTEISGKALGMETCDERDIMIGMDTPTSLLQIGYMTNEHEGELLQKRGYLEKIADGIVKTVEEYYEGE